MTVHRTSSRNPEVIAGMTVSEVARHLGVPRSTIYRWHSRGNKLFRAWAQERDRSAKLRAACDDLAAIRRRLEGEAI